VHIARLGNTGRIIMTGPGNEFCSTRCGGIAMQIRHRIEQTKSQIHESHNRVYIDSILIEIDTLNWVLNEICSFGLEATSEGLIS
jgi:hypothetical protein